MAKRRLLLRREPRGFQALRLHALCLESLRLHALCLEPLRLQALCLETLRLQPLRLETLRLQTLGLETLRLQTLRLETLRLQTLRLETLRLQPLRLSALRIEPLGLETLRLAALGQQRSISRRSASRRSVSGVPLPACLLRRSASRRTVPTVRLPGAALLMRSASARSTSRRSARLRSALGLGAGRRSPASASTAKVCGSNSPSSDFTSSSAACTDIGQARLRRAGRQTRSARRRYDKGRSGWVSGTSGRLKAKGIPGLARLVDPAPSPRSASHCLERCQGSRPPRRSRSAHPLLRQRKAGERTSSSRWSPNPRQRRTRTRRRSAAR